MNKLNLYCKLSGLIFSYLCFFSLLCEAQPVSHNAGELIYGIKPYPDMDFFSTIPNSSINNNGSFYDNIWHGFSLNQQLVYNRILLSSIPPSPALSYKNAPYNKICLTGDTSCTETCEGGANSCYRKSSQDMWVQAIKAYSDPSIKFNEQGYIVLTDSSGGRSPAYPPALSLIRDKDITSLPDTIVIGDDTYPNLFSVNGHIKAVHARLSQISENIGNWHNWYSWCSHPPSLTFRQYDSLSAGDPNAINLMSLLEPTSTPSTIDSNKAQIALQNNCLTDSLNYITTQLRYNNERNSGYATRHFPFNINYNLPGIVNLGSIEETLSGSDVQILPSRSWFDAVGIFNYYLNRCSMEKLVLEDVLNCLELIQVDKFEKLDDTAYIIGSNDAWGQSATNKIGTAPVIHNCQTKYSDWFDSVGGYVGGDNKSKPFVYFGIDSEGLANGSFYNYKILQNLRNTTIDNKGLFNKGVYVDVCVNPKSTDIGKIFQGENQLAAVQNKAMSGREWVTPCKGGTCPINMDSDNPFNIFNYILGW